MKKHHAFHLTAFFLYIIFMTALMISQGIGITPDRYAFVLLIFALLIHKTRRFLLDWIPFLFILISYDFIRSLANKINPTVHYTEMINFDKFLFGGQVPTIRLQGWLFNAGNLHWYDYTATLFYLLHFVLPLVFGFILWTRSRRQFQEFTFALLLLSYTSWLTYLVFPAAPPWLASQNGFLPHLTKITDLVLTKAFPQKIDLSTIYGAFDANLVAAVPSLHIAYPTLIFMFCLKFFRKKGWLFLPYVFGIAFSVIYLGEHYMFDVLLGIIYAAGFFLITQLAIEHHLKAIFYLSLVSDKIKPMLAPIPRLIPLIHNRNKE